jgi:hypothetical protein
VRTEDGERVSMPTLGKRRKTVAARKAGSDHLAAILALLM